MSTTAPLIKRHNHRVHPCENSRKNELLKVLIAKNSNQSIIVVTANDPQEIKNIIDDEKIIVVSDTELADSKELKCDLLISYDLPEKAIIYMGRLAHSNTFALILLEKEEEKLLYPIETLLGRTIMQEIVEGFEVVSAEVKKEFTKPKRDFEKSDRPKRNFDKTDRPKRNFDSSDKPKRDFDKSEKSKRDYKDNDRNSKDEKKSYKSNSWDKKTSEPSKYIGKDENGKAMFSGKTRERNHRHDGKPKDQSQTTKAPRKINIKPKKVN